MTPNEIVNACRAALGEDSVLAGDDMAGVRAARYLRDWSPALAGRPLAVVLPRSTAEVVAILRICHDAGQPVVPQGGMTGLSGAAVPRTGDICLSLEKMTGIGEIDLSAGTMTVLAGTTLGQIHEAAAGCGMEFALDMGSRDACRIGGVLATNAGGIHVLQSGTAREQVLGMEVVLADGTVLTSLNKMIKNNAGYDLKYLFIGSEGTLGVITRAVLRLRPRPLSRHTALCGLSDYAAALRLFRLLRDALGSELAAFELMWADFFEFGLGSASRRGAPPLARPHALCALVEQTSFSQRDGGERLTEALSAAMDEGVIADAVIPQSIAETQALWRIRESTAEFPGRLHPLNFDVSLPIGTIGQFADECKAAFEARWPGHRSLRFGHIGDSNLHVTVDLRSIGGAGADEVDRVLYPLVEAHEGSVSAEHGIGVLKREFLACSRTATEIETMRIIKKALDPRRILNPGKVLPE